MAEEEARAAALMLQVTQLNNFLKVPDPIKQLPTYDGAQHSLMSWIQQVETILRFCVGVQNTPIYERYIEVIRTKLTGRASKEIEHRRVPNAWPEIRANLIELFADDRDLSTLCQSIPYLVQEKGEEVKDYYGRVLELSSSISEKIQLDATYQGHENAVIHFASNFTMNAFIDGLNPRYASFTRNARPANMSEAYHIASQHVQADRRAKSKMEMTAKLTVNSSAVSRRNIPQNRPSPPQSRPAYQNRQTNQRDPPQNFNPAPRGPANNFQNVRNVDAPAPMEVDNSRRSRHSAVPMSLSTRHQQISNAELAEEEEIFADQADYDGDYEVENFDDEINFQIARSANGKT